MEKDLAQTYFLIVLGITLRKHKRKIAIFSRKEIILQQYRIDLEMHRW